MKLTCRSEPIELDELRVRVTSADSDGALLAFEIRMPPGGGPPGLHRHAAAELYRVERGEFAFYVADGDGQVDALDGASREMSSRSRAAASTPSATSRARTARRSWCSRRALSSSASCARLR